MRTPLYVDVLTDLLQRSRARGAAFSSTTARGAWGLTFPGSAPLSVHALVEGEAHLWSIDPKDALHVFPGDVVLVREHTPHHLASRAGARCVPLAEAMATVTGVGRRLAVGDPGEPVAAGAALIRIASTIVKPPPGVSSGVSVWPKACMSPRDSARPRPTPVVLSVSPSRWNGVNIRSRWSSEMPGPRSAIRSSTESA